jgi:AcrR family transcriptional regulator
VSKIKTNPTSSAGPQRPRQRRADAEQNVAAILDAATRVLGKQSDASIEDIAISAGVSRQTVYAHYASREVLINAVIERGSTEVKAAFEAARLEDVPPTQALLRLIDIVWATSDRYPFVWQVPAVGPEEDRNRHGPLIELIEALIMRGQATGEFDPNSSPTWVFAATLALVRAAEDEVKAGRSTVQQAITEINHSVLRLFGVQDPNLRA